jgi:hypothetical protein
MCRALKVCMRDLKTVRCALCSPALLALPLLAAAALSACVIVPVDPKTGQPYGHAPQPQVVVVQQPTASPAPSPAAPQWTTVSARLYPVNYQGQALQGEATRVDRNYPGFGQIMSQVQGGVNWSGAAGQRGIANAANSSNSMRCEYLFTAAGQGTGACVVNDGSRYQIHFGS